MDARTWRLKKTSVRTVRLSYLPVVYLGPIDRRSHYDLQDQGWAVLQFLLLKCSIEKPIPRK